MGVVTIDRWWIHERRPSQDPSGLLRVVHPKVFSVGFDSGEGESVSNWVSLSRHVFRGAIEFGNTGKVAVLGRPAFISLGESMN